MYRVAGPRLIRFCSESLFRQTFKPPLRCCSSKPSTTSSLSPLSAKERVEVVTKVRERQSGEESEDSWTKDTKRKPDPRDRKDPRDEKVENTIIRHEHRFANIPDELRNKETFHNAIGLFLQNNTQRRGQVEFIYAALRHLKKFGVHKDLDTYKALLDIFPKAKMIPQTSIQRMFKHYPMHQDCCVKLLDEMEWHGCEPDKEISDMVGLVFGQWNFASKKMKRMMYWRMKLRHSNPFVDRRDIEGKQLRPSSLAKWAMKMICRDPGTVIYEWLTDELENRKEKTWIVCGQSPMQQRLIERHPIDKPLYVNGPFTVYLMEHTVSYFTITADADPNKNFNLFRDERPETAEEWRNWKTRWNSPISDQRRALMAEATMHEQPDGTILACAATGTSSKESSAACIDFLQRINPRLEKISVVFRVRHTTPVDVVVSSDERRESEESAEAAAS